jgi:hypothetical protein
LADIQLIHDNCVKFNGTQNNLPELAKQVVSHAKKQSEVLYKRLLTSTFNNVSTTTNSSKESSVARGSTTIDFQPQQPQQQQSFSRIRQRGDQQQQQQSTVVATTTAIAPPPPQVVIQPHQSSTTIAPTSQEQIKNALANAVSQIQQQYETHPVVSGPLAVHIPRKLRERIIAQHLSMTERCNKNNNNNGDNNSTTTSSLMLMMIPPLSSEEMTRSSSKKTASSSSIQENDLVVNVLLDFFAAQCAKSLNVSVEEIKQNFLIANRQELATALETSDILNPRNFLQQKEGKKKTGTTTLSSNRKLEQYWAVLARVILPWFNSTALVKFVYVDEKVNGLMALMNFNNNKNQQVDRDDSATSPINKNNNNHLLPQWHKLLHFDVLSRSLLEMPIVVQHVLKETLDRSMNALTRNQQQRTINNNNNDLVACDIVSSAIVPVVNDLLQFIADEKLE